MCASSAPCSFCAPCLRTRRARGRQCATALVYPVPDRLHGQVPPGFREHMQAFRGNVEVDDGRLHAIGEIGAMVDVARQERNRRPACNDVMLRVEVGRVGFPIHIELSEPPPPAGGEQYPDGELVHQGSRFARAGGDGGMWHASVQLLQVPCCRLVVTRPSFVASRNALQQLPGWHGRPQHHELLAQDFILAPPHLVQLDLVHAAPLRTVLRACGFYPGQLPEVAGKHQGRDFVRSFPHLNDAFEIFLAQQGDLVHGDDVVLGEAVHDLHSILVEEESARAGIHIGLRVFGADGASW